MDTDLLRPAPNTSPLWRSAVALAFAVALATPQPAEAGVFSFLARMLRMAPADVEEAFPTLGATEALASVSALSADSRPPFPDGDRNDSGGAIAVVQSNAIVAPLNPIGTISDDVPPSGQIFVYTVRSGDTITAIAKSFGVSVNTILWANNISDIRALKVGDQLVILPVSGVRHEVKKGETVAAIARRYQAGIEDILQFNGLASDEGLRAGAIVIVPNGELREAAPLTPSTPRPGAFAGLPLYEGYYVRPVIGGRRSRGVHGYNGVDLAASCGLPVLAAADGQVLVARSTGWNGGYGRYVVITHPNATQTLYGHLREVAVAPGTALRQGVVIGSIGSSGNSTGCHVHFEVRGARNPF